MIEVLDLRNAHECLWTLYMKKACKQATKLPE